MTGLYSAPFIAGAVLSGTPVNFAIPDGFVAVIRQVTVQLAQPNLDQGVVQVFLEALEMYTAAVPAETTADFNWNGRVVSDVSRAPTLLSITAQVLGVGAEADVYVGGYLLTP